MDIEQDDNQQTVTNLKAVLDVDLAGAYVVKDGKFVPFNHEELLQHLVIFVVRHGHKCHAAGMQAGKDIAEGKLEPEEEG